MHVSFIQLPNSLIKQVHALYQLYILIYFTVSLMFHKLTRSRMKIDLKASFHGQITLNQFIGSIDQFIQ